MCSIMKVCLLLLCTVLVVSGHPLNQKSSFKQLMTFLRTPVKPERYSYDNSTFFPKYKQGYSNYKVNSFNWKSCNASAPVQASVVLVPDPIVIPGDINLQFKASVGVDLTSKISLDLTVKKKIFVWVEIPCVDSVGSCTYDDVCTLITPDTPCPDPLPKFNIPCHCPIAKGDYVLPTSSIVIPTLDLPDFLTSGDYQVSAKLNQAGQQLACFDIDLSIEA